MLMEEVQAVLSPLLQRTVALPLSFGELVAHNKSLWRGSKHHNMRAHLAGVLRFAGFRGDMEHTMGKI